MLLKLLLFLQLCVCLFCRHVHVLCSCLCLVLMKNRRMHWIPWNCGYRWLWTTTWLLGIKPRSSGRAANALRYRVASLAPIYLYSDYSGAGKRTQRIKYLLCKHEDLSVDLLALETGCVPCTCNSSTPGVGDRQFYSCSWKEDPGSKTNWGGQW